MNKMNGFEVNGNIVTMFLNRDSGIVECYFDIEELDKVMSIGYIWYTRESFGNMYVQTRVSGDDGTRPYVHLHRLIMDCPDGLFVDHIDGNGLNNVKSNLRIVTKGQNNQNKTRVRSDARSGVRGVSFDSQSNKWKATIKVNGKQKTIGRFNTVEQAGTAVAKARAELMPYSQEAYLEQSIL